MLRKVTFIISGFLFISCISKNREKPLYLNNEYKVDVLKEILRDTIAGKLINSGNALISNRELSYSTPMLYFDSVSSSYKKEQSYSHFVSKVLNMKDTNIINKQIDANLNFELELLSKFGFHVLDVEGMIQEQISLDSIDKIVNNIYKDRGIIIDKELSNNYLSISKPIFNKEMDKTFLRVYSGSGGFSVIYEKKKGKWLYKEEVERWVE